MKNDRAGVVRARGRAFSTGKAVFMRREQRPGWRAALPIYVIWCADCARFTESHPAGYGRIRCGTCRHSVRVMTWRRFRDKELKPFITMAPFFLALAALLALLMILLR